MKGYLGQVQRSRSKVKVTRSKTFQGILVTWKVTGTASSLIELDSEEDARPSSHPIHNEEGKSDLTPYMIGRATTEGVKKAYYLMLR